MGIETDTVKVARLQGARLSAGPKRATSNSAAGESRRAGQSRTRESRKLEISYRTKESALKTRSSDSNPWWINTNHELTSRGLDTALKVGESLFKLATKGV